MTLPKIYGLIGYPVKHSLSPLMHNAAFKAININAEYRLFEVKPEELEGFLEGTISVKDTDGRSCFSKDVMGFNITVPHKIRAFEFIKNTTIVHSPDITLFLAGAVNTIKRENGKLHFRNTDTTGFVNSLREDLKFNTADKIVIVFGCGGAGRAIVAGLLQGGMNTKKIYMYDINTEAMETTERHFLNPNFADFVKGRLEFISREEIPKKLTESDLLVNATPIGMKEGDGSVIDKDLLHKKLSIYDVVYNRQTQLIKDAKSLGFPCADGLGMLLYQGAASFEFWTEKKPPIERMREALNKGVGKV